MIFGHLTGVVLIGQFGILVVVVVVFLALGGIFVSFGHVGAFL